MFTTVKFLLLALLIVTTRSTLVPPDDVNSEKSKTTEMTDWIGFSKSVQSQIFSKPHRYVKDAKGRVWDIEVLQRRATLLTADRQPPLEMRALGVVANRHNIIHTSEWMEKEADRLEELILSGRILKLLPRDRSVMEGIDQYTKDLYGHDVAFPPLMWSPQLGALKSLADACVVALNSEEHISIMEAECIPSECTDGRVVVKAKKYRTKDGIRNDDLKIQIKGLGQAIRGYHSERSLGVKFPTTLAPTPLLIKLISGGDGIENSEIRIAEVVSERSIDCLTLLTPLTADEAREAFENGSMVLARHWYKRTNIRKWQGHKNSIETADFEWDSKVTWEYKPPKKK
jgi:hypothetical protein